MEWWNPDFAWPVAGAILAGALIGFEREYRGRPAGFRTHILVALASALLMLAAVHQVRWLSDTPGDLIRIDPVRMAHGILTGVGFLCGGVIFREGFSVHGLTTAASLWITSALGTLFGVGFYGLAVGGTLATLVILGVLRLADDYMPQMHHVDVAVRYRRSAAPKEADFCALMAEFGLKPAVVKHALDEDVLEISATFRGSGRVRTEALSARLADDATVIGFDLTPRND
ncbi:MAG: MgtC/SapB family protein [Phenylobacterium sp.]|jgi:putative Mg2+ transporter-C (MgtC) family protein|uniref:MgtC/SapB family protein n=1 Tax=Phenylobacterium sp. TaxID=1871053 RepID=UPI00391BD0C3